MKTSFNKKNPKKILGYLMAFAMVLFSLDAFAQPANDDCASAIATACGTTVTGDNTGASANAPGGGAAIWYSIAGDGSTMTISTCGTSFDTRLYVLDACGGTQVAYNDDGCSGSPLGGSSYASEVTFTSVAGVDYKIAATGYSTSTSYQGTISLNVSCVAPPTTCVPTTVVTLPYSGTALTNCGSGNDVTSANSSYSGYYLNGEDETYEFVGSGNDVLIDLTSSTSYTGVIVFDGCPILGGTVAASSTSSSGSESLSFTSVAGTTYYVVIDTWASPNCIPSYDLSIADAITGCMDPNATNYDATANLACVGCCVYPACSHPAPLHETFSSGSLPAGSSCSWFQGVTTGSGWVFTGNPGYSAAQNGRAMGSYAWIDFSSTDVGAWMQVEDVDVSSLTVPELKFDYFSDQYSATITAANTLFVEAYDGAAWNVIGTFDQFTIGGWETKSVNLTGYDVAGIVSLRFRAESTALPASYDYWNDLLVDDVKVEEYSVVIVSGCTDSLALNYNSNATVDDGSCLYPPSNDDCASAEVIACGGSAVGNNTGASANSPSTGAAIWYSVTGQGGDITVSLCGGTAFDTRLYVFDACGGTQVAYNDDFCGLQSEVTFTSTSGVDYKIAASGYSSTTATGAINIAVTCTAPPVPGCTDSLANNFNPLATVNDGSCTYTVIPGCTDSNAVNYNPLAQVDDGSCAYSCASGIGANQDGFETATGIYQQGPWTHWTLNAVTNTFTGTNAWRSLSGSTGSGGTGPTGPAEGSYYLYCETSGQYGRLAELESECVDLGTFTAPTFVASYHMYGATMGTLNIDASNDQGASWSNVWTATGDQGNSWQDAVISLAPYAGQIIQLRMSYTSGTSFTGDCSIDNLRFMEAPVSGCMDSLAANWNSAATIDDGSCQYPGCMDPMATNYCSTCNVNDSLSCTYPACQPYPFSEDWESGNLATQDWISNSGINASVYLQSQAVAGGMPAGNMMPVINGSYHLEMTGHSTPGTYLSYATEAAAYANTDHVASATICVDMSTAGSACEMTFEGQVVSYFSNVGYAWGRVKVEGAVVADINGNTAYNNSTIGMKVGGQTWTYDMSAYSGMSSVNVTFEFAGRYSTAYSIGNYGCFFRVDDISLYDLSPCSYYAASAIADADVTCNGGSDGSATASAVSGSGAYSYAWSNGATTASISGLSAGTYSCIVTDDTLGCVDTASVTIAEPSTISLSAVIGNESAPWSFDGQIDLSVSGGTPCSTSDTVLCHPHLSSYNSTFTRGWWFQAQSSFTVSGLMCPDDAAPGVATNQSVAIVDYGLNNPVVPFALPSSLAHGNSFAAYDVPGGWVTIPGGFQVIAGNYYGLIGAAHAPASATLNNSYGSGGLTVNLDGIATVQNRLGIQGGIGAYAVNVNTLPTNTTWGTTAGSIGRINLQTGVVGAQAYTFAWSNGQTTEDASGLTAGTYSVTVTDCDSCSATASYTVITAATPGCTDTNACNYDYLATVDDGSCTYPGCTDTLACNYDATAGCDDGSCYNLAGSASSTDASCNGGSDGSVSASANAAVTYFWTQGMAYYGNSATVSGLSAGTYTCAMTDAFGCVVTVTAVVGEPSAVSLSAVTIDPTAAGNDGSIDLSVSGGTPCVTSSSLSSWNSLHTSNASSGIHFNVINNHSAALTITGFGQGSLGSYNGANNISVYYMPAAYVPTTTAGWTQVANAVPTTIPTGGTMTTPVFSPAVAMTAVSIPAGATYGFYVGGTSTVQYSTATATGPAGSVIASDPFISVTSGHGGTFGAGSFNPRGPVVEVYYGAPGASAYTFAWSNGATTEDISNLGAGTYSVTATDCNGCTATGSYTLVNTAILGCMNPLACNYDSTATVDDGSCNTIYGCMNATAFNYDSTANCPDTCIAILMGCTDPLAVNYSAAVNTDDGSCVYYGCTDPTASNYNAAAVVGCDATGSTTCCVYPSACGQVTGVYMSDVIHDRATFNWDDMNSSTCNVDQIRIQYREVGSSTWSNKTMGAPVGSGCNTANTYKRVLGLSPATTYEYEFKMWYCGAPVVNWHAQGTFTTAAACDNVTNVSATANSATQAQFCWTNPASHAFVRLQYRENVPGSSFSNIGGFGVMAPATCKIKNGLTPATQYRVMYRTWCNATGGPYRSPQWDGPVIWDQPSSIRVEGGTTINNLDVYPNPSRDIFNVTFTSEDVQNLEVRIINVIGEVIYTENLEQFVGEYTKQVDLATYTKGIYFLEITTANGVINKKLILQ